MSSRISQTAVLVLTVSPWDEPKRLRKELTEVLSRDGEVIYVTLPYGFRKPSRDCDDREGTVRVVALAGPPLPLRVLRRSPLLWAAYERRVVQRLRHKLRDAPAIGAVFCFTPDHPFVVSAFNSKAPMIYVANDDYASMAGSEAARATIQQNEAETIAHSDRVISVSAVIARKLAIHGKPVHVMYPGHDCDPLPLRRLEDAGRVPHSLCFFGYIDWRVDFDLLAFLLDRGQHVVLVGPIVGTTQQVASLQARFARRFELHAAMAAEQAPALLARFEVLIMPYRFRSAEQAEAMELPNKTFVYLSALRPIVTTDMPNLKMVETGIIYRSHSHEHFLANCLKAVEEDSPEYAAARRRIAEQNTWESRRVTLRSLMLAAEASNGQVTP